MNLFVAFSKLSAQSGEALGRALREELDKTVVDCGFSQDLVAKLQQGTKYDYVINFGCTKLSAIEAQLINNHEAVANCANKLASRHKFRAADVPAPQLWENPSLIPETAFPVLARTTRHSRGQGLWLCPDRPTLQAAAKGYLGLRKKQILTRKGNLVWRDRPFYGESPSHYLELIHDTREFRVHVIAPRLTLDGLVAKDYLVLKLSEKIPGPKGTTSEIVKNKENGWFFAFPKDTDNLMLDEVRLVGKQALACSELHFGAVDVVYSKKTNKVYVLEVNSAPCLTDDQSNTMDKYLWGISVLLGIISAPKKKSKETDIPYAGQTAQKGYIKLLERLGYL